jgi:predicted deacylase
MIKSVTYAAREKGPHFLVMAAIHGNEKCGTIGCQRVMDEIESGALNIIRGHVTFVPIANPRAYRENRRQIERNLNRYMVPTAEPNTYEAQLSNILCPMLAACDVHMAIHSYTVGGDPFILVAPNDTREHALAASLGPYTLLTGWEGAYSKTGRKDGGAEESTGTIEYARRHGAIAINIECGQHKDPHAEDVAYNAIRNALRHLEMTAEPKPDTALPSLMRFVTVTHVYYRDDEGKLAKPWKHLEGVKKNEPMAFHADGLPIPAPDDGFIIMPKENCPIGDEWFYLGVER